MKYFYKCILLFSFVFCLSTTIYANSQQRTLKVGIYNNYPKIYVENGIAKGIFVDILEEIAKNQNLNIEYKIDDWNTLINLLENNEIDLIPDVAYSEERDSMFKFNQISILTSWLEIFSLKNNIPNDLSKIFDKKIGVLKGSIQESFLMNDLAQKFNSNLKIITFDSYNESTIGLTNGTIEYLLADRFYYLSTREHAKIQPTGIVFRPTKLLFAFNKETSDQIIAEFDKAISGLKNNSNSTYYQSISIYLNEYQTGLPTYLKAIFILTCLIGITFLAFTLVFRRKLKLKTQELRTKNQQLTQAIQHSEESDRLKTMFLQNMSHEVRTPLNSILGFMEIIQDQSINFEDRNKFISLIKKSSYNLLNTLTDLVTISKIQSNIISPKFNHYNITETVDKVCSEYRPLADKKNISIHNKIKAQQFDPILKTDQELLSTIFSKLLDNAIKFSENDSDIYFMSSYTNDSVTISLKDDGIGINSIQAERIFNHFEQGKLDKTKIYNGSGLGLSIAKAYANLIDAKLWMESEENKGSTFHLRLSKK